MLKLHSSDRRFWLLTTEEAYQYLLTLRTLSQIESGEEILTRAEVDTAASDGTFSDTSISDIIHVSQDSVDKWHQTVYLAA